MKNIMNINAGKRIGDEIKKRNIKQKYVADFMEVSESYLSSFISGKRTLSLEKILLASELFGITIDEIFSVDDLAEDDIIDVDSLSLREVKFLNRLADALKDYEEDSI